jgi:imidazolonepropionase-like amidohydrolase
MKRVTALLLLFLSSALLLAQTKPQTQPKPIVFTHVTIIDATGAPAKSDMTVIITGDRIREIGRTGKIQLPKDAQVVDATGKFLIPGLWDMHTHGLNTPQPLPLFIANGITGVRFMGGAGLEQARETRKAIESGGLLGPRVVMVAPVVDGSRLMRSFARVITSENEAREAVNSLKNQGDFLKVLDTLRRDVFLAFVDEARRQKITVVGHLPVEVSAAEASDAGLKSIEHLNGLLIAGSVREAQLRREMSEAVRKPGARAGDILFYRAGTYGKTLLDTYDEKRAAELFTRFRKNGTWVCPTLVDHRMFAFPNEFATDPNVKYLPRSQVQAWKSDQRLQSLTAEVVNEQKKIFQKYLQMVGGMHQAGIALLAGSDFGVAYLLPGFSLHDELALFVQAGFTPMEALQTATINPAKFLGRLDSLGTVEKGKLADLVLLDANPLADIHNTQKINAVVVNGRLIPKSELQAMLASVEAEANKK